MTITLELTPELEAKAQYVAKYKGIPLQAVIQQALERMPVPPLDISGLTSPASTESEEDEPNPWWDRAKAILQPMWDSQPTGPKTNYSELEEACDVSTEKSVC